MMSEKGRQKRRFDWPSVTSAPTRGADVGTDRWRVSTGPLPDSCTAANYALFDRLVGECEQAGWDGEPQRTGGLEIDCEGEILRLLDW